MDRTTTLRVRAGTRDRVRALGAQRRQSSDAVVAAAVDLLEKQTFWDAWQAAQQAPSDQDTADERADVAAWDRASVADLISSELSTRADR